MTTGAPTVALTGVKIDQSQSVAITASAGTLILRRSNIVANSGGGLDLRAVSFDIQSSFITKNGGSASAIGGVAIYQLGTGAHKFMFNTVAQNGGTSGLPTGVSCSLVSTSLTFSDNIVYGNVVAGAGTQVAGTNCAWTYSDIGPDTVAGDGNLNADPSFMNAATSDFHITPGSPVIDQADPAAPDGFDVDNTPRPQGGRSDMGADEL